VALTFEHVHLYGRPGHRVATVEIPAMDPPAEVLLFDGEFYHQILDSNAYTRCVVWPVHKEATIGT